MNTTKSVSVTGTGIQTAYIYINGALVKSYPIHF